MKKLIKFELTRMKYKKLIFFLPLVIIGIGLIGIIAGSAYNESLTEKMKMLNLYQAYTQFSFIFLGFIYAYVFTEDFSKGISNYLEQMGYSLFRQITAKIIILFLLTVTVISGFAIAYSLFIGLNDFDYSFLIVMSMIAGIMFTLLFICLLSILLQKVLITTICQFILYILFDVLNIYLYGLTNPCDANSLSTVTVRFLSGLDLSHKSLETLHLNFTSHKWLFSLGPAIIYALTVGIVLVILIFYKRRGKYNK